MVKKISGSFGTINQNFPIWEAGCVLYWKSTTPTVVQTQNGFGIVTPFAMNDGSAQASDYWYYDQGMGAYVKVVYTPSPYMPKNGFFNQTRTSYHRNAQNSTRGFTAQAGLTATTSVVVPANYIMDPVSNSSWLTNKFQLTNSSGSTKYAEATYANVTSIKGFGVLAKRADGEDVTSSDLVLWISDTQPSLGGASNVSTGTVYRKCRSDGWFEVTCKAPSGTVNWFSLEIPNGVTNLEIEFPCTESFSSSTAPIGIDCVTFGSMPDANTKTKRVPQVSIAREDTVGTGLENWPEHGWMAATVVPPYDATNFIIPSRRVVSWDDGTANNRINLYTSSSNESLGSVESSTGGESPGDYWTLVSGTYAFVAGMSYGIVISWGRRGSANTAYCFINGTYVDGDSSYTLPAGTPPATIRIGSEILYTNPANCWVQQVAIGRTYLSKQECRALSIWMKNKAQNPYGDTTPPFLVSATYVEA